MGVVQTEDVPVPQNFDAIVEVVRAVKTAPERTSERIPERIPDVPVPQIFEDIVEVGRAVKTAPERTLERTVVRTVGVPVPQTFEEIMKQLNEVTAEFVERETAQGTTPEQMQVLEREYRMECERLHKLLRTAYGCPEGDALW